MSTLTGQYISQSYGGLIQLSTNTGIVSGSYTQLQDGFGNDLGVWFNGGNTGSIKVSGSALIQNGVTVYLGDVDVVDGNVNLYVGDVYLNNNNSRMFGTASWALNAVSSSYISNNGIIKLNTNAGIVAGTYTQLSDNIGTNLGVWVNGQGSISGSSMTASGDIKIAGGAFIDNAIIIGRGAGNNINNTVMGYQAGFSNNGNSVGIVAIGYGALDAAVGLGSFNTAVGYEALTQATSASNTAFGYRAGNTLSTGVRNTFIGSQAGTGISTGRANTIIGGFTSTLPAATSNNIILADGDGNIKARYSGSWTLTDKVTITSGSDFNVHGNNQFHGAEFFATASQSGSAGVSGSINFNSTGVAFGVSVVSNSRLTVVNAGVYNIQFSAQIETSAGADTMYVWFKKNGNNIADSATKVVLANNTAQVMTVNILDQAAANDYYEVAYQTASGNATVKAEAATGNIPAIPSVIATLTQVR